MDGTYTIVVQEQDTRGEIIAILYNTQTQGPVLPGYGCFPGQFGLHSS